MNVNINQSRTHGGADESKRNRFSQRKVIQPKVDTDMAAGGKVGRVKGLKEARETEKINHGRFGLKQCGKPNRFDEC